MAATIVIIRQKRLVITVRAFFSEKYFFIFLDGLRGSEEDKYNTGFSLRGPGLVQKANFFDKILLRATTGSWDGEKLLCFPLVKVVPYHRPVPGRSVYDFKACPFKRFV